MPATHAFGVYLTKVMDTARLTIADLERETGINNSLISKWRRGTTVPSIENLRLLAPALGIPLRDLVVRAEHMRPEEVGLVDLPEPPVRRPTLEDDIRAEADLSDDAKQAMILMWRAFVAEYRSEQGASKPKR